MTGTVHPVGVMWSLPWSRRLGQLCRQWDRSNIPGLCVETLPSSNVTEPDWTTFPTSWSVKLRRPLRRFDKPLLSGGAYYRNGRGNFIQATRYLHTEVAPFPRENVKNYGKGLLIKAKDLTPAKMLLHLQCSYDFIFDSVLPHRTFNYSWRIVWKVR